MRRVIMLAAISPFWKHVQSCHSVVNINIYKSHNEAFFASSHRFQSIKLTFEIVLP